jgi:coenzyme PQQ precursor peptide PqqA
MRYTPKHAGAAHAGHRQGEERTGRGNTTMAWTTPTLVEICIGLEINGYLPAEI